MPPPDPPWFGGHGQGGFAVNQAFTALSRAPVFPLLKNLREQEQLLASLRFWFEIFNSVSESLKANGAQIQVSQDIATLKIPGQHATINI